jgi:hypothetical protein
MTAKKFIIALLFASLTTLIGCSYNNEDQTVNHNNEFQITIPGWVKKETLAPDASVSYTNRYRNFYLVVIGGDKNIPWDSAKNSAFKRVYGTLDSASFEENLYKLQEMQGVHYEINGKTDKESDKIFYSLYVMEGKRKYYQICLWTRGAERRKKYNEAFYKIIQSFKEI